MKRVYNKTTMHKASDYKLWDIVYVGKNKEYICWLDGKSNKCWISWPLIHAF